MTPGNGGKDESRKGSFVFEPIRNDPDISGNRGAYVYSPGALNGIFVRRKYVGMSQNN